MEIGVENVLVDKNCHSNKDALRDWAETYRVLLEMKDNDYCCSLCENLFEDPVTVMKCGHEFCHSCIEIHLDRVSSVCPVCGVPVWKTDLNRNKQLKDLVAEIIEFVGFMENMFTCPKLCISTANATLSSASGIIHSTSDRGTYKKTFSFHDIEHAHTHDEHIHDALTHDV